ncbi:PadR family transcriptional regulator [Labedella gwakjiensis]|uniref:PadR family transcriptional regulator n=1 Tax=Labedella gwakjiensis TaxID=390269 RepID=A0A2P8GXY0_9MICO|nr:PadR family transcriptional regulator [Labedella gwakjiensis]PSL38826.1 PadR family transcriptional regulator [Labedella gwakjiensis]RUQ86703.1 PadR family transcriptional regulator [Labedella gwakjiensis]
MTVRQSLLAILAVGPCYGYQLRAEFDRRTGSTWPLNVGQIYTTLERLERDGLVRRGETDAEGHLYWEITIDGRSAVTDWFTEPVRPTTGTRDELAVKVAIASTLPGVDAAAVVAAQRSATTARLDELERSVFGGEGGSAEEVAWGLLRDGLVMDAETEMRWLDRCAEVLGASRPSPFPLSTTKPRRGRPAKAATTP